MEMELSISIPSDIEGFVPLQCPLCNEYFKLTPSDMKADDILEIWCPYCGIKSLEGYITSDIKELGLIMSKNQVMNHIYKELGGTLKKMNNSIIKTTVNIPKMEYEERIQVRFDALEVYKYCCCSKSAKVTAISKMIGSYCPFCGVSYDGN